MAKCSLTQAFGVLYLIVSAPILADCRRIDSSAAVKKHVGKDSDADSSQVKDNSNSTSDGHPWCNWFSSMSLRSYHFDVSFEEGPDGGCETGMCTAIELVRDKDAPLLKLHGAKAWLVERTEKKGELKWDTYSPGPDMTREKIIDLLEVESIRLYDAYTTVKGRTISRFWRNGIETNYPDKLEITLPRAKNASRGPDSMVLKEVFELEGGLYYDEELIGKGFKKLTSEEFKDLQTQAAKPSWYTEGRSKGKWIGAAGGALSVGGMYTAATVTGVAVQTQALVGAATCGLIGGAIGGALAGGIIGLGIMAIVAIGYGSSKASSGYEIRSAGRKIFEKLRCIKELKTCSRNILVPKDKDCPRQ